MHKKKLSGFLLVSTALLLVACQNPATDTTATEAATSSSQVQSATSKAGEQAASRTSSLEAAESAQAQSAASSSTTDAGAAPDAAQTAEGTLIEQAKQTITQLTGYVESDVYLFIVEEVEGNEVTINVRENGPETASSVGFYRYDGSTGELLEMDVVTGEYTRHPAQY